MQLTTSPQLTRKRQIMYIYIYTLSMYWHVLCVYNIMYVYGSKHGTSTLAIAGCRFMGLMITGILYYYVCSAGSYNAIVHAGVKI